MLEILRPRMGLAGVEIVLQHIDNQPEDIRLLLDWLPGKPLEKEKKREANSRAQKCGWVLNHLAQKRPELLSPFHGRLVDLLDDIEDPSTLREVLKALNAPEMRREETAGDTELMFDLGCGWMADEEAPKAMVYLGIQMIGDRWKALSPAQHHEAFEGLEMLLARKAQTGEKDPLSRAARKVRERWRVRIWPEQNRRSVAE